MKKIVLTFGFLSGGVSAALMLATIPFIDRIGRDHGLVVGYTGILASFLLVFFGVRSYRENVSNGALTFTKGFTVGILITLISCLCYVVAWEVLSYNFMPDFADKYAAHEVDRARASGASQQAIDATAKQMEDFKRMYANPAMRAAMTFLEPFPVGLLVTLVSAAALRRKPSTDAA